MIFNWFTCWVLVLQLIVWDVSVPAGLAGIIMKWRYLDGILEMSLWSLTVNSRRHFAALQRLTGTWSMPSNVIQHCRRLGGGGIISTWHNFPCATLYGHTPQLFPAACWTFHGMCVFCVRFLLASDSCIFTHEELFSSLHVVTALNLMLCMFVLQLLTSFCHGITRLKTIKKHKTFLLTDQCVKPTNIHRKMGHNVHGHELYMLTSLKDWAAAAQPSKIWCLHCGQIVLSWFRGRYVG